MLIPADRVLSALISEFDRLRPLLADSGTDGSAAQAIANALRLLRNREFGDLGAIYLQLNGLAGMLGRIEALLAESERRKLAELDVLRDLVASARAESRVAELEEAWRRMLGEMQSLIAAINATQSIPTATKTAITRELVAWESADLIRQAAEAENSRTPQLAAVEITIDNLTAYLRDRFADPALRISALQPLAGGFGKQTIIFDVAGEALSGSFVMRRDIGEAGTLDTDCHLIRKEYPVIKAAFARGFPAPDAVWLDTEHRLLPGGDFIVMRKSPGTLAGSFFGAQTAIPDSLTDVLAENMARLHALPPLTELGDLTDSIRSELWSLPARDCIARYIRNSYEFYLGEETMPSPALVGLYGWLLDNLPQRQGRAVLLHGDIGFHNFLLDNGQLSAVLDWEFAHIGDPAEDLGYVKVTVGASLDWDRLMDRYVAAGGAPVDPETLRFFQVWAYVRNATAANIVSNRFSTGRANDLKLTILPHGHIPQFIRAAQALIDSE